ncbi:MAG: MaoC family dehydratase N-terminal domain-containing protein [Alphaproteobacteria bacterium]|nr:MaoC family dehydratase N-terminal domain-containing protein [Alphaproteobacteria bacterium]MDX5369751.1 MaoC family dehydratase N-terminal domain-containing protein [Alphaproteobacteria bacterium]MDX5464375.1 MaoC family dehydratase N-terminal domain-containing protein [Alphaproteobacteria bacterium]
MLREIENYKVYFDTLEVGERFVSEGRTVTERDIIAFAGLSGDFNALHIDAEYAATTQHGQRIAHGLLVLSIASGLSTQMPVMKFMSSTIVGLANLECRWLKPTFIGDTIHVVLEVTEKVPSRSKPDRGTLVLSRKAVNQRGETVMDSVWKLILKKSDAA